MKKFKVKIISAEKESYWYSGSIGQTFTVKENFEQRFSDSYAVEQYGFEPNSYYIFKEDCEVLDQAAAA